MVCECRELITTGESVAIVTRRFAISFVTYILKLLQTGSSSFMAEAATQKKVDIDKSDALLLFLPSLPATLL